MSDSALSEPATQPLERSRVLAALLSLIAPGSGHIYIGRMRRGVVLLGVVIAGQALAFMAAALMPPRFVPMVIYAVAVVIASLAIYLFCAIDAVRLARRPGDVPRWYVTAGAVAALWLCSLAAGALIEHIKPLLPWRSFSVASSSMEPTLRFGEWFLADMKRAHAPARGDVVVYRVPRDPDTIFVKRIVALAGDRILFREGRVFVNGAAVPEPYINAGDPRFIYNNTREIVVPAGHVFVAGDNRANSTDSRVANHGFVPAGNVIGRASEIFWSKDEGREGTWVGSPAR